MALKPNTGEKRLIVYLYGEPIGLLDQTPLGRMVFMYFPHATRPLSLGMPLREEPYEEGQIPPWGHWIAGVGERGQGHWVSFPRPSGAAHSDEATINHGVRRRT